MDTENTCEVLDENTARETHLTMRQISVNYGIPYRNIRIAVTMFPHVQNTNNSVNWEILKPLYEEHQTEIEEMSDQSLEKVRTENAIKDGILKDIQIANLKEKLIEKEEVHSLLKRIAAAQCSLFNSKFRKELPSKLHGKSIAEMSALIDAALSDVFGIINKPIGEWEKG
jgi:hypothetical protein